MNGDSISLTEITDRLKEADLDATVEVVVSPPHCYLQKVHTELTILEYTGKTPVHVAAQNVHESSKGAFTGEISCEMAADCGASYVILGHSERRHVFGEGNERIGAKTQTALAAGMKVIACIGEKLEDRDAGRTMTVCVEQLTAFANNIAEDDWKNVVIAYEPVWAIGTGKTATPELAQETHQSIRLWLASNISTKVSGSTRIIYGGSVNEGNCKDLSQQSDIDGFLVGGASLKPQFVDIINCTKD